MASVILEEPMKERKLEDYLPNDDTKWHTNFFDKNVSIISKIFDGGQLETSCMLIREKNEHFK